MPKCIICGDLLPPQFMVELDFKVALDEPPKQCMFCKGGITEINMTTATGKKEKFTKTEAKREYMIFLNMLKEKADVLHKVLEGKAHFETKEKTTVVM